MAAELIDGRTIAKQIRAEVLTDVTRWTMQGNPAPGLATILVGDDHASAIYVNNKLLACKEVGINGHHYALPTDTHAEEVIRLIDKLNHDPDISGILLQLPTPAQIDGNAVSELIAPEKDVDGLTPASVGLLAKGRPGLAPCTPLGIMELLHRYDVEIAGANAVIVGRSNLVGKPVTQLLLAEDATVTLCHSRTRDLEEVCRGADILIAAVGRNELIQGDWVKPGATVIDVGINRGKDGLVGDVDFVSAREHARLITPVPGGVGPMTIAMLLRNTLKAAQIQKEETC